MEKPFKKVWHVRTAWKFCNTATHPQDKRSSKNNKWHSYNTRHGDKLAIPYHRINRIQEIPTYDGIKFYNITPIDLKELPPRKFYTTIKKILTENSAYSTQECMDIHSQFFK